MGEMTKIINSMVIDPNTGNIRIGVGATGHFRIAFEDISADALNPDTDIVIFSAQETKGEDRVVITSFHGIPITDTFTADKKVFHKLFPVNQDEDGTFYADISLTNADTRAIGVGEFLWNATLVTDPEYDDDGNPIVDDADSVAPIYLNGDRPHMTVEEVGYVV